MGSKKYHFFFFFGFLIFILAGGIGILNPSSVGSVIFIIFLTIFNPLLPYLISFIFSYVIFGVKFNNKVFSAGWFFICSKKWSDNLYKLLASINYRAEQRLTSWKSWSETFTKPPNFKVFKWLNPSGFLTFPFSP